MPETEDLRIQKFREMGLNAITKGMEMTD